MKAIYLLLLLPILFTESVVSWQSSTTHDFGDIKHRQPVTHTFEFKNITDQPFVIDNVRTACGCTSPDWSEEPILPDSTAAITIEFDAHQAGYFYKWIKVYFSTQRKAEKLYVEGYVLEP